jgi:hypothetical protein
MSANLGIASGSAELQAAWPVAVSASGTVLGQSARDIA